MLLTNFTLDNPNFIIVTIDEYQQEIEKITNRAGILISLDAILATSLLLFSTAIPGLSNSIKALTLVLPVIFVLISFVFFYVSVFARQAQIIPTHYLRLLSEQKQYEFTDQNSKLSMINSLERINKYMSAKTSAMQYGNSFLVIAITLLVFTNLTKSNLFNSLQSSNSMLVPVLIGIIGLLLAYLLKKEIFKSSSEMVTSNIREWTPPTSIQ